MRLRADNSATCVELFNTAEERCTTQPLDAESLLREVANFCDFGSPTVVESLKVKTRTVPVFINEFWTAKQRDSSSLHEISYRACFKGQLPGFFIERLTKKADIVFDPFMGRGTTLIEAALHGRIPYGIDINPLSAILVRPRLDLPSSEAIAESLAEINFAKDLLTEPEELLHFYHPQTLAELAQLKAKLRNNSATHRWIRMVATNRLTGHSPGFFSVYTLPPNQAVSVKTQIKINLKRNQTPEYRDTKKLILKKSRSLLKNLTADQLVTVRAAGKKSILLTGCCSQIPQISSNSVSLVVTSPPFLDVVDYNLDNWLRCWFNDIEAAKVPIWKLRNENDWASRMAEVFLELYRILKPGGFVAFEVGEVKNGKVKLENLVLPVAIDAGFSPLCLMINQQEFTKTSHCWGVDNQQKGTNSNRIVVLQKTGS